MLQPFISDNTAASVSPAIADFYSPIALSSPIEHVMLLLLDARLQVALVEQQY